MCEEMRAVCELVHESFQQLTVLVSINQTVIMYRNLTKQSLVSTLAEA
jgi:hypothetical protein